MKRQYAIVKVINLKKIETQVQLLSMMERCNSDAESLKISDSTLHINNDFAKHFSSFEHLRNLVVKNCKLTIDSSARDIDLDGLIALIIDNTDFSGVNKFRLYIKIMKNY